MGRARAAVGPAPHNDRARGDATPALTAPMRETARDPDLPDDSEAPARRWLLADVGGTRSRFCLWSAGSGFAGARAFANAEFASLEQAAAAYLREAGGRVGAAAIAVAGPVEGDAVALTNLAWPFSAAALRGALGLDRLRVVNDFAAAAAGVAALGAAEWADVRGGRAAPGGGGVSLVLGPGTGLGVATVVRDGEADRILPTEGGHAGFAPFDAQSLALYEAGRERWGRVSWERLASGPGLAWILQALGGPALDPPAVSALAAQGDPLARRAAAAFSACLGACAGDLVLSHGATGGVWLAGGVVGAMGAAFDRGAFSLAYASKGRFSGYVDRVPVRAVLAGDLAFRGLARIVAGAARAPGIAVGEAL